MPVLILEANREGYGIDQLDETMTVSELMRLLKNYDDDTPIYLSHDNGYTYGTIKEMYFKEMEFEDDED